MDGSAADCKHRDCRRHCPERRVAVVWVPAAVAVVLMLLPCSAAISHGEFFRRKNKAHPVRLDSGNCSAGLMHDHTIPNNA